MNRTTHSPAPGARLRRLLAGGILAFSLTSAALAGPGAHGPGGEHLDGPAASGVTLSALPRFETRSDLFEVVGEFHGDELSLFVDRFATNEPVIGASVEVESGGHKGLATFHADLGDYSVTEPALLAALKAPGEHALVLTIVAGDDTDLLDGSLTVGEAILDDEHGDEWTLRRILPVAAGLLAVLALITVVVRRRRAKGSAL